MTLYIYGMDSLETKTIDSLSYQKNHRSVKSIETEVKKLISDFHQNGYINCVQSAFEQDGKSYSYQFDLGEQYKSLHINYSPKEIPSDLLEKLGIKTDRSTFEIPFEQTESVLNQLSLLISNRGRPFSSLKLTDLEINETNSLQADLKIDFSGERILDSIIIKGYEKFPRSYLKNYARIKKGQRFDKSKLDKKTEELKSLGFVSVPRNPEVLFTEDQTLLYLYLEKQNSNHFEGFLGFSTDEETQKFQLDGDIRLDLINNLNYGEALSIHYKNTANDQQQFQAELKLPYLFSTPVGVKLNLDLFKQDSTYTVNSHSLALTYQINSKFEISTTYKSTTSTDLLKNSFIGQAHEDYDSKFALLGGTYLNRNSNHPLFPIKTSLELQLGLGKRNNEGNSSLQQFVDFSGKHLFELDLRNSIWISNQTYLLFSDTYLSNELGRFGGVHSIRGFEENSLRASFFSGIQTEYRFLLSSSLYAHSIIDYAYLKNDAQSSTNNLYGVGFGLGLETKAGLLNLAFANGKADKDSFKFENTKVHISLVASF